LYQPFLTAQLGLFGKHITAELLTTFFDAIPKKFRYWDMMLNHKNLYSTDRYPLYERMNYVLELNKTYEELFSGFRENIRRNIKRAAQYGCHAVKDVDIHEITALAREQIPGVTEPDLENFVHLFTELKKSGKAASYGILSNQNQLLASSVFLFSNGRAYYILVGNHPNGRTLGASHALINEFIREHAGRDLKLDFEGSDIRNLGFFYNSFGAKEEKYTAIKMNRLPRYLKWFKR
jgi:lipid II:glycine glycyltransferase (peptidoglycan interpeptide bridge formation enzyme)